MPLPITEVERELRHTRRVRFEGYKRADGLWDIEGHLSDVKSHDNPMKTGVRRAEWRRMSRAINLVLEASLDGAGA